MKVTTEELERCEVLLTLEVDPAQEQDLLKKAARRIAREVQIPGFRPGKAPYNTILRRFGLEAIQQEALEQSADKLIQEALLEARLMPFAQIAFEDVSWTPLTLKVKVPGPPKVELGEYRDLRLEVEPVEVGDEDVEKTLKELQEQNATWAPVERPAQLNDLLAMAVVEKHGDEILAENEAVEYELTPPQAEAADNAGDADEAETPAEAQPDLTTPLLGLSAGEEKTFTLTYPESFQDERYAGKEITFTVKVSSVKEKELDPLDDEFAKSISDFETLDELKADVRQQLKSSREQEYEHKLGHELLDKIIENAKQIEWPVGLEEESLNEEVERFGNQFRQAGLALKDYLKFQNKTEEEFREELRENTVSALKQSIVLGELARLEKLEVSNSEVLSRAKSIADAYGGNQHIWQSILSSETYQNRLANELLADKVIHRLAQIAKGEAPELETEAAAIAKTESDQVAAAGSDEVAEVAGESDGPAGETNQEPVTTKA